MIVCWLFCYIAWNATILLTAWHDILQCSDALHIDDSQQLVYHHGKLIVKGLKAIQGMY